MATGTVQPTVFLWQGRDKRGVKLKGQQIAASPNLVRAELRRPLSTAFQCGPVACYAIEVGFPRGRPPDSVSLCRST